MDSIYQLIDVVTGYQAAAVVTAAVRTGVFDALTADEAQAPAVLAAALGVSEPVLAKLLTGLEGIGLVSSDADGYRATEFAARELGPDGDMSSVVEKEAYFAHIWLELADTVRSGEPRLAPWTERLRTEPRRARHFLEALDVLARRTGPALGEMDELAPDKRVLDVGGGLGSYSRLLAAAGSRVTLVDLPEVIEWAAPGLAGVAAVRLVAADVLDHPSCGVDPGSHDAALVSHMLHDLDRVTGVGLLRAAARAVVPGGVVVVNDFAADSGPGAFGPMFDLMMAVETGGNAYPEADLAEMMREAGLTDVRRHDFEPPLTVMRGVKP